MGKRNASLFVQVFRSNKPSAGLAAVCDKDLESNANCYLLLGEPSARSRCAAGFGVDNN